ncbi:yfgM [Wigglesworthia glossinidia endosymbiont of Glossina brevipalpis]|uniref:Ancillary SecYEG translocon subunit n=1 Tax=Wigglesworthia glossinidia brevipalpis TaxID=36870 RepID=Q8D1Y1_WIGBR|nr:yfgM [Wigglesworthia glossinidia endosymbiont of Glossina brevipalpis]
MYAFASYNAKKEKEIFLSMDEWNKIQFNLIKNIYEIKKYDKQAEEYENIYSILVLLGKAKISVEQSNFKKSEFYLENALMKAKDENLKSLISLRLSKVMIQQKKIDKAINILNKIDQPGWKDLSLNILNNIKK